MWYMRLIQQDMHLVPRIFSSCHGQNQPQAISYSGMRAICTVSCPAFNGPFHCRDDECECIPYQDSATTSHPAKIAPPLPDPLSRALFPMRSGGYQHFPPRAILVHDLIVVELTKRALNTLTCRCGTRNLQLTGAKAFRAGHAESLARLAKGRACRGLRLRQSFGGTPIVSICGTTWGLGLMFPYVWGSWDVQGLAALFHSSSFSHTPTSLSRSWRKHLKRKSSPQAGRSSRLIPKNGSR